MKTLRKIGTAANQKMALLGALVVATLATAVPAHAALPAIVGTSIGTIQTDALAAIDLVWPLVMAILGGMVILKIVKRVVNKA